MLLTLLQLCLRWSRVLPPGFAWWLGGVLGYAAALLPGREQARCRDHLARAYPLASPAWVERCARRVFRHMGRMALWNLATLHDDPRRHRRGMVFEGLGNLAAAIAAGRRGEGTVILSGHFGNWELLAQVTGATAPVTLLGRHLRNPALDALVRTWRGRGENRVVYQDEDLRRLLRELRQGRLLGTLPDQDVGRLAGCFVPWFGHLAYTPLGPAALAQVSGCRVQPVYCYWRHDRWVWHWGPRWPVPRGPDRLTEQTRVMARCMAYQEALVRRHPEQWVWFHRRWRRQPGDRPQAPIYGPVSAS